MQTSDLIVVMPCSGGVETGDDRWRWNGDGDGDGKRRNSDSSNEGRRRRQAAKWMAEKYQMVPVPGVAR